MILKTLAKNERLIDPLQKAYLKLERIFNLINLLREDEGASVEVCCDNPEGPPYCSIKVVDEWTGCEPRAFKCNSIMGSLEMALKARGESLSFVENDLPTVDCPDCGIEQRSYDGGPPVYCAICGWCDHPAGTGGICDICGEKDPSSSETSNGQDVDTRIEKEK